LHGGLAGAPCGERNGNFKHGRFTKKALKEQRDAADRIRALKGLGDLIVMFK
jgi:hypothetical protein